MIWERLSKGRWFHLTQHCSGHARHYSTYSHIPNRHEKIVLCAAGYGPAAPSCVATMVLLLTAGEQGSMCNEVPKNDFIDSVNSKPPALLAPRFSGIVSRAFFFLKYALQRVFVSFYAGNRFESYSGAGVHGKHL